LIYNVDLLHSLFSFQRTNSVAIAGTACPFFASVPCISRPELEYTMDTYDCATPFLKKNEKPFKSCPSSHPYIPNQDLKSRSLESMLAPPSHIPRPAAETLCLLASNAMAEL
ncbi:hypothetical protein ACLBWT_23390, partial [Paenibacillus sp. D51F]